MIPNRRWNHRSDLMVQAFLFLLFCFAFPSPRAAQFESIEGPAIASPSWINAGQFEGHLATHCSPAGAFSPDSRSLAVIADEKIALIGFAGGEPRVLRARVPGVVDLTLHSASFVTPERLFVLANGLIPSKKKKELPRPTPTLAFLWDIATDSMVGKVNTIKASG